MIRNRMGLLVASGAALLSLAASGPATWAQANFPERPIELVVTFGPGGGADLMGRTMARLAEPALGVAVPVSNVSGASGNAGLTTVLTNPADGHTVATLIALTVSSWAAGLGTAKPEDFTVVAMAQSSPSMLFVPKNSPVTTAQELFDQAKANPQQLRVATSGYGTMDDITLRYLAAEGYPMTNVPFGKPAERYASTVGAHTDVLYEEPGDVAQFIQSGDLRPLIVFAAERHAAFPDVPTSEELGLEVSDLPNFRALAVRADTPPERIEILADAFNQVLETEEWRAFCEQTYTCIEQVTPEEGQQQIDDFYEVVSGYMERFAVKAN
jgi:tripartite-type tricarboxylate transporter receptor subunit TctC